MLFINSYHHFADVMNVLYVTMKNAEENISL